MARPSFVATRAGQVRVWESGDGPAVLVLAGLVTAARVRAEQVRDAVGRVRVVAVDLPGFGTAVRGAALDGAALVGELEDVVAALRLGDAPVLAFDLACPLAEALVHRTAASPTALVLVGETAAHAWARRGLAPPSEPRSDGTHLTALWAFLRDRNLLDPQDGRRVTAASPGFPAPGDLDAALLAAASQPEAYAALWSGCVAAVGAASLPPTAAVHRAKTLTEAAGPLRDMLAGRPDARRPPVPAVADGAAGLWLDYVDTPAGRIHLRCAGHGPRPLMMFQSAPGSAAPLEPIIVGLAAGRRVVAPDFLGNGESDKASDGVDVGALARNAFDVADALGFDGFDVWGTHTGALVALEMMLMQPARIGRGVLEAPILLDRDTTAEILRDYFPPLLPDRWGLHLQLAWNLRRDMFLFWPWYRQDAGHGRRIGAPDLEMLHDWTIGLLRSGHTYSVSYRAGFSYPTAERLPRLERPALICAGPADMLSEGLALAGTLAPGATVRPTPATVWYPDQGAEEKRRTIALYDAFLAGTMA